MRGASQLDRTHAIRPSWTCMPLHLVTYLRHVIKSVRPCPEAPMRRSVRNVDMSQFLTGGVQWGIQVEPVRLEHHTGAGRAQSAGLFCVVKNIMRCLGEQHKYRGDSARTIKSSNLSNLYRNVSVCRSSSRKVVRLSSENLFDAVRRP
jgi:hypothetical protein